MKILFMVLLVGLVGLSGCAAGKLVGKVPQIESDNFATVHIARKAGFTGCGVRTTIQIDDIDFYFLACGECISFKVPAGKELKISQTTSMSPYHIFLEPEKGKDYYFGNDCHWICWFDQIEKGRYKSIATTCEKEVNIE